MYIINGLMNEWGEMNVLNVVLDFLIWKLKKFDECAGVGKVPLAPTLGLGTIQTSSPSATPDNFCSKKKHQATSVAKK